MNQHYKLLITRENFAREFNLPDESVCVRLGTTIRCDHRLVLPGVSQTIELELQRSGDEWSLECLSDVYIADDNSFRKQFRRKMAPGDRFGIYLQETGNRLFYLEFAADFGSGAPRFDKLIDIRDIPQLSIGGGASSALRMREPALKDDCVVLSARGQDRLMTVVRSAFGVYLNGSRVDHEAVVKDTDFFSIAGYHFYYKNGVLFTDSAGGLLVQGHLRCQMTENYAGTMEYPKFVRNVRRKIVLSDEEISVLNPPEKPKKPKNNLFLKLLPTLCSLVIIVGLRTFLMQSGGAFIILSAATMSVGLLTSVITFITSGRDYKKEVAERETEYRSYIQRKQKEIKNARSDELQQLSQVYRSPQQLEQMVRSFSGELFDRLPEDTDFLHILVGYGAKESLRQVKITTKETITLADDLARLPEKLQHDYRFLRNAPIYVDACGDNAIGVVGDDGNLYDMVKLMTLDLCTRQYYSNLKLVYLIAPSDAGRFSWARWLPHVGTEIIGQKSVSRIRNIVSDEESKTVLFDYLYAELSKREQSKTKYPHFVVFVLHDWGLKMHPMSRFIPRAAEVGFTFVFFDSHQDYLPQGCDEIITLGHSGTAALTQARNINSRVSFRYHPLHDQEVFDVAIRLAPVYSEEVSLENALIKNISLFEMLDIVSPADINLAENWKRAAVYRSMAAPLGVKSKNELVYLDLHEKAHGPHGLVAGTTGSGKSELLQSYIISMAILYHPYEVGFVIIDFKGGGMANQFRDLPHLMGAITNIDGREIDRSLKSIKAELQKRQRLFAETDVNKIDDYIRLYKSGQAKTPLPHLIIVVDEFAELKAEQPDFMKELISAARIGRSLGVHLILATQKPAGQVNEQIWSNSRFKLCLKVATVQDSNEVLKSPLAAEIREPGRAYLQVGNNEIFELFQSAYSGGPADAGMGDQVKEFDISEVSLFGKRTVIYRQKAEKSAGSSATQLDAVVEYIDTYCRDAKIERLPEICLPSLPEVLNYVIPAPAAGTAVTVPIGLYDDPAQQYQGVAEINLTTDNLMLIGSSQMGKTNLLQTVIRGLAEKFTPEELTLYIIDCNSMILKNFERMKHVGGVVTMAEDEAMKNLFKLILKEISHRKEKLMNIGVSSYASYREAGLSDMPQIVLMIDNLTAMRESYEQFEDALLNICRDGIAVGISVIVANAQTSGIGYKYLSNFPARIALTCNNAEEYSTLFSFGRMRPAAVAGRCLIEKEKTIYECQTYLAFEGEKEIDRVRAMRDFCDRMNEKYASSRGAANIPVIPKTLSRDFLVRAGQWPTQPYHVIFGLDYSTVGAVSIDASNLGLLAITGRSGMGRSNFVRYLLRSLNENRENAPVSACVIDGVDRKLAPVKDLPIVSAYSLAGDTAIETLAAWDELLQQRYDLLMQGRDLASEPLLLMIIRSNDALAAIAANADAMDSYRAILGRYKSLKVGIILADMENAAIAYSAPDTIKPIRDTRHFLVFENLNAVKVFDVPLAVMRQFKKEIEPGDCYYSKGTEVIKLKTVLDES